MSSSGDWVGTAPDTSGMFGKNSGTFRFGALGRSLENVCFLSGDWGMYGWNFGGTFSGLRGRFLKSCCGYPVVLSPGGARGDSGLWYIRPWLGRA